MKNIILRSLFLYISISSCASDIPEMVLIDSGSIIIGDNELSMKKGPDIPEMPTNKYDEHLVSMDSFWISQYEVTITQFVDFIKKTGVITQIEKRSIWDDYWYRYEEKWPNHPVINVTWQEALLYCKWLSDKTGDNYRLPTEAEWEYVASGNERFLYPWGNEYEKLDKSQDFDPWIDSLSFKKNVLPVGTMIQDISPFGVQGMYGNVKEFVLDGFDPEYYIHSNNNNPLNIDFPFGFLIVVRGQAGYVYEEDRFANRGRRWKGFNFPSSVTGFRVVKEKEITLFNKDTDFPFIYEYSHRKINAEIPIYDSIYGSQKVEMNFNPNDEVTALYKYEDSDKSDWIFVITDDIRYGWIHEENTTEIPNGIE